MAEPEDDEKKGFTVFGRDISKIPCFRTSFLYGIGGGVGAGFLAFMATSRPPLSMHIGMGIFSVTTLCYWFPCRYKFSQQKFEYSKLQSAMKKQAIYEGTALEEEIQKNAKSA